MRPSVLVLLAAVAVGCHEEEEPFDCEIFEQDDYETLDCLDLRISTGRFPINVVDRLTASLSTVENGDREYLPLDSGSFRI